MKLANVSPITGQDEPAPPQSTSPRRRIALKVCVVILVVVAFFAVLFAAVHYLRKPIRDAKQIQQGDTVERVRLLLGSPTTVFETDAELRRSDLGPMSFVFTDTGNIFSDVPVDRLPVVNGRAEWYEYAPTAGHLVFYDDNRVEIVFRGGT